MFIDWIDDGLMKSQTRRKTTKEKALKELLISIK